MLDSNILPSPAFAGLHSFAPSVSALRLRVNPFLADPAHALSDCEVGSYEGAKQKEGAKKIWGAGRA
jgi:hypothetical protein